MVPDSGEKGGGVTAATRLETATFWKSAPWLGTWVAYRKSIFYLVPGRLLRGTAVKKMLFWEINYLAGAPGVGLVVSLSGYRISWT